MATRNCLREQRRVLPVQAHHVAKIIIPGVFKCRIDQLDREVPMLGHVMHHGDLFFLGRLAPIDNGAGRAKLLDHFCRFIRRAEEYKDNQRRQFVQHLTDDFRAAFVDEPVDIAIGDLAYLRFDFIDALWRERITENLAVLAMGFGVLVDKRRLDRDVQFVAHAGGGRTNRRYRWHSACVAVLLKFEPRYHKLAKLRLVYTVHNLALQGIRFFVTR